MTARAPCCIPFCRRSVRRDDHDPGHNEYICARCWRAVPKTLKACYRRAWAGFKASRAAAEASGAVVDAAADCFSDGTYAMHLGVSERYMHADARCRRLWRVCKRRAVEAAAGLA